MFERTTWRAIRNFEVGKWKESCTGIRKYLEVNRILKNIRNRIRKWRIIAEIINRTNRRGNYKDEIKFEAKTHLENCKGNVRRSKSWGRLNKSWRTKQAKQTSKVENT